MDLSVIAHRNDNIAPRAIWVDEGAHGFVEGLAEQPILHLHP